MRVILDTDIGTDVDDIVALSLILCCPELQLEGVTCVYGNVDLRARMVQKMLRLRGVDVPVRVGLREPLLKLGSIYWEGHEGVGLLTPEDAQEPVSRQSAVDFIIETVLNNSGQIHLLCIGPLSNAAAALLQRPDLTEHLAGFTIMGGAGRINDLGLPYAEHNIRCDPMAAHIVFSSGIPITTIPLDVTTKVRITHEGAARIRAAGTPFHEALATQIELYPRVALSGWTYMHDPLAAAVLVDPGLVQLTDVHIDILTTPDRYAGTMLLRVPEKPHLMNARIALTVDTPRFETMLIDRLVL